MVRLLRTHVRTLPGRRLTSALVAALLWITSLAMMLTVCLSPHAEAAGVSESSALDQIIERGTLRVGTTGDYKPFSYHTSDDRFIGLDPDMAADLAEALGVELELVPTSWPTLMQDFHDQRFDIAMSGISVNLDRQKTAWFSRPYQRDGKTPITLCERQADYQTLEQIDQPGVRVIVNPGGTNERFARGNLQKATIVDYDDNVTIFDQIVQGKADLMMTDAIETRLQANLHPELCAVHPDQPFNFSEKAVLLPKDMDLKFFVDQWLRQLKESGSFDEQLQHWLDHDWPQQAG
ncbi:transporter substrate-binding domain-containing protein [Kushneria indalinina]|uniref:Cyclohexadienyl dehydratase n=1 Tax=Kushneria indalinina DSM 14324 TaxID=1122140 RepID=A0A3D9DS61_9GAMM|nr:transporter substrate-binding domain-containing protein [Kushneria indalinina]REC93577.1 cyclohexadienyl dehydratase [Kushneria indalinina DSM 14324]